MERQLKKTDSEYKRRFTLATYTQRWAVTMTKVRIRQAVARTPYPHWHLLSFCGPDGGESRGVVDLIAIRKDHGMPSHGTKRGDAFQMILIQVKGGYAARPTLQDAKRLRAVARRHCAYAVLLATWKKGKAARFYSLGSAHRDSSVEWTEVRELKAFFG